MHSPTNWKLAAEPNYKTNIDLDFPYSDLPHLGESRLVKIPVSLNNLIKHVDYFGEGRIVSAEGVSGFANCYNINHQYRLVSSGPDKDKKIPNRIPILSYTDCNTSVYIKDNSVLTVTVAGERMNSSCIKDIARIINNDFGTVVLFGVNEQSRGVTELAKELFKKRLFPYNNINITLPNELQGLTLYDEYVIFLNSDDMRCKDELFNSVVNGNYECAVNISRSFLIVRLGKDLDVIIQKLIRAAPKNVMVFAYKLWHGGAKDVVLKHFPNQYQYIVSGDTVTIVNYEYDQALKLDSNVHLNNYNRAVWGDNRLPRTSDRLSWKILPVCKGNDLTFKLYNCDCNLFMRMDDKGDQYCGEKRCWGSPMNEEKIDRFKYYFEPEMVHEGVLVFLIMNIHQKQQIKLEVAADEYGDRLLWGNNLNIHKDTNRNKWVIAKWSSCQ